MQIVENLGSFTKLIEYEYTPTAEELMYWYGGTSGVVNPNNIYAPKRAGVTRVKYFPHEPKTNANGEL